MLKASSSVRPVDLQQWPDRVESLRVAIVSDAAPERNGVGTYYRDLAEHLKGAGVRVSLIAPRFRRGRWHGGVGLPLPGDPSQKIVIPWLPSVTRRLRRLAPNTIVVPTPGPYGLLGMALARRRGIDLVVGFHTHFEALTDLFQDWKVRAHICQTYLTACNRLLFHNSSLVLANSRPMIEVARRIGAHQVALMGTPIPKRFLDRPVAPLAEDLRRVLFAGRLAPEKNLEAVVEAARRLPEMEFSVAGDGPLRPWLLEQASALPNLSYLGWMSRGRLLTLLDGVDALLLPSKIESFGTIALEAMARGRVVLVSRQCGIASWDLFRSGLFPVRDDEHTADALVRVRDLDYAIRLGKARQAREAAVEANRRNLDHWLEVLDGKRWTRVDDGR